MQSLQSPLVPQWPSGLKYIERRIEYIVSQVTNASDFHEPMVKLIVLFVGFSYYISICTFAGSIPLFIIKYMSISNIPLALIGGLFIAIVLAIFILFLNMKCFRLSTIAITLVSYYIPSSIRSYILWIVFTYAASNFFCQAYGYSLYDIIGKLFNYIFN